MKSAFTSSTQQLQVAATDTSRTKHPLLGSESARPKSARRIGPCNGEERISVKVMVRHKDKEAFLRRVEIMTSTQTHVPPVSRAEYVERFGASAADFDLVADFASGEGLTVGDRDPATRMIKLSGTVAQMNAAFGVELTEFEATGDGAPNRYRSYDGEEGKPNMIHLQERLRDVVVAVLGLDERPHARPHFTRSHAASGSEAAASGKPFTAPQVGHLYGFPKGDGNGQCIAIVNFIGGYAKSDLDTYFSALKLPTPEVVAVSVDGSHNAPTGNESDDGEVTLDIEIAGAIAPAAKIAVYTSNNTKQGFVDAVSEAIHDAKNAPSVVSISWGAPEDTWDAQSRNALDYALAAAVVLGVTVFVASGDLGSTDGSSDGHNDVDFPSASPYVLACGGTQLSVQADSHSVERISREVVWNDPVDGRASGGGRSAFFALPVWQHDLELTLHAAGRIALAHRGVPDVAAHADARNGYEVFITGKSFVFGGTSAAAPLWAGLIARINALAGRPAGFVNARLYANRVACRNISEGNNGAYDASRGWDACTGLGSPDGGTLLDLLRLQPATAW
jgi:kumamolisin